MNSTETPSENESRIPDATEPGKQADLGQREIQLVAVLLEEFRWHFNECLKYIDSLNQFANLQLIALGAFGAGLTTLFSQGAAAYPLVLFVLLVAPLPICFLSWSFEHCHFMIASNAGYIERILRPKLNGILGRKDLFEWEDFLRDDALAFKTQELRRFHADTISYANPTRLAVALTIICIVGATYVANEIQALSIPTLALGSALALIDLCCLVVTVLNHRIVVSYFRRNHATRSNDTAPKDTPANREVQHAPAAPPGSNVSASDSGKKIDQEIPR